MFFWSKSWKDDQRCKTIYNGLPKVPLHEKAPSFWQQFNIPKEHSPKFINIARMVEQKNHIFMVEVIARYKETYGDCHLVLIGKEHEAIKKAVILKAKELNCIENIIFAGEQSNVYEFINNADAMLFPSLWEGLPGAVIEAASTGLPVISSRLPGTSEISNYLPSVKTLSLQLGADAWSEALNSSISLSEQERKQLASEFDTSPFCLASCIKAIHATYQR